MFLFYSTRQTKAVSIGGQKTAESFPRTCGTNDDDEGCFLVLQKHFQYIKTLHHACKAQEYNEIR